MFTWSALYDDDSTLFQFDKDKKEHLFKEIKQEKVIRFGICDGRQHIVVDLRNGRFYINGTPILIPKLSDIDGENRLIYFRRVRKSIGTAPDMDDTETESFIGFQTTIDGVNKQAMLSVIDAEKLAYSIHIK